MLKTWLLSMLLLLPVLGRADETAEAGHFKMTSIIQRIKVADDFSYDMESEIQYKVLTEQGARQNGKYPINYNRALTRLQVLQAETIKADGRRIPVPDSGIARQSGSLGELTFKELELINLSFPDLAAGDSVLVRYRSQNKPLFPGHFTFANTVNEGLVYDNIEVQLDVPEKMVLDLGVSSFSAERDEIRQGRRAMLWRYSNKLSKGYEIAQTDAKLNQPHVWVSTFMSWNVLAKAYMDRHAPQAAVTPVIISLAKEVTQGATTEREKAQRIYDWVRKNIRYIAIYAGLEGWVPHKASDVLAHRFGDCKDHAVLLDAMLHAVGIASVPVLIQSDLMNYQRPLVVLPDFNHAISYLPGLDLYLDSTSVFTEFGRLPDGDQGKPVLRAGVVKAEGMTPSSKAKERQSSRLTQVKVNAKGGAQVETTLWFAGDFRGWYEQFRQEIGAGKENNWAKDQLINQKKRGTSTLVFLPEENGRLGLKVSQKIDNYLLDGEIGLLDFGHAYVGQISLFNTLDLFETTGRTTTFTCRAVEIDDAVEITLPDNIKLLRLPRNQEIKLDGVEMQVSYATQGASHSMQRHFQWQPADSGSCSAWDWWGWSTSMRKIRSAVQSARLAYERS